MTILQSPSGVPASDVLPRAGRLQRVLDAHRMVTADVAPAALTDRLLRAAVRLTGAECGAVEFLSSSGGVTRTALHPEDLDHAQWRVGAERRDGARWQVSTVVTVRGEAFLELHVGAAWPATLDDDADELLQALGELAGTTIENGLLHDEARRSKDWLQASGEIARTLLSDAGADADTLMQVVLRALHVADADTVALLLPDGNGRLRVAVTTGRGSDDFRGRVIDADSSLLGRAALRGESVLVDDMAEVQRDGYVDVHGFGPVMAAPLVDARGVRGSVVLCRRRGRSSFTTHDLDLATAFADQLALALEMDDARLRGEWVKVLEDRHRIAQDLHDNVMQRLFATGVGLQSLAASTLPADVARRLGRYITDLDETIDEIRTRVFGLRGANGLQHGPAASRFPRVGPDEIAADTP
jgi:signal transduction histidine kinase